MKRIVAAFVLAFVAVLSAGWSDDFDKQTAVVNLLEELKFKKLDKAKSGEAVRYRVTKETITYVKSLYERPMIVTVAPDGTATIGYIRGTAPYESKAGDDG